MDGWTGRQTDAQADRLGGWEQPLEMIPKPPNDVSPARLVGTHPVKVRRVAGALYATSAL